MTALDNLDKYGNTFQTKVLGLLLTDKKFLVNVSDSLTDEYFENPSRKWIIKRLQKYFDEYHTTPTLEALSIEVKKEENDVLKIALTEELKQAYSLAEKSTDNEYIEKEFSEFCQNQQMKKAIMTSVDLLNDGDYESIRTLISKAIISFSPVMALAIRRASSLASLPEFTKCITDNSSGKVASNSLANSSISSFKYRVLVFKTDICCCPASTTFGCS